MTLRVVVTGATGFLGVHTCRALCDAGHSVTALVQPASRLDRLPPAVSPMVGAADLTDLSEQIRTCEPDAVLHLAGPSPSSEPADLLRGSIGLALAIAKAAEKLDVPPRVVEIGSWWEYDEYGAVAPINAYAAAKQGQRLQLAQAHRRGVLHLHSLILHDLYGDEDWRPKLLPTLLQAARDGESLALTPGDQVMGWIDVRDAVGAVLALLKAEGPPESGPGFWSCVGELLSLKQVVSLIQASGGTLHPQFGALTYPPQQRMKPAVPAQPPPGWRPQRRLCDMIEDAVRR